MIPALLTTQLLLLCSPRDTSFVKASNPMFSLMARHMFAAPIHDERSAAIS